MSDDQAKRLAHEFTMEYLKFHPAYLSDIPDNIPKMIDEIADINMKFYESIIHHKVLTKLY